MGTALVYVLWRQRYEAAPPAKPAPAPRKKRPIISPEIDITEAPLAEIRAEAEEASAAPAAPPAERLEVIRGIGPKFAERLHAAGIHTFAALAAETPERLREIVRAQSWQKIEPEAWIAEARRLAEE